MKMLNIFLQIYSNWSKEWLMLFNVELEGSGS